MPEFDLRGIRCGKYTNTSGTITYATPTKVGDAMTANFELRFAEGRLYAESKLAEYIKEATGGTISIGVKYILDDAKEMMFGATEKTRSLTVGSATVTATGRLYTTKDTPNYVGVGFYAPDMVDGVKKYTCVFAHKALFGPPAMSYQTKGENIVFQTPTITGEFLGSDAATSDLFETATVDTEAAAIAWIKDCLGETT